MQKIQLIASSNARRNSEMQEPGQKLRRAREQLRLTYRDVEEASQQIATLHGNHEYLIGLSRLADIENKGTLPSVYRLYSLCAIYKLKFAVVLRWFGVELERLPTDAAHVTLKRTHPFDFSVSDRAVIDVPVEIDDGFDLRNTSYLSRHVQRWGRLSLALMGGLDLKRNRYAFIGTDDWSMHPIISPGSFLQVDVTRRKIARDGWSSENERPIYFVESRERFRCCWCTQQEDDLFIQFHPSSQEPPGIFPMRDVDVIGLVVGVAMRLDLAKRRHTRS
jgi:transcriptional regulator with XRE-family HTH domain